MAEKKPAPQKEKALTYRGKPLVRSGNTIYYGVAEERFMVKLEVLESRQVDDIEVANRVAVNLIRLENGTQRVIKHGEKAGVFDALDIGGVWLERTLSEQRAKTIKQ
ncbi:MAG: hypothetical protein ACERKO_09290 [Acetanaerobacterium sp.]